MTNFERIGVNHQFDAHSIEEANKAFARSCEVCCSKGRYSKCSKCAIDYTHQLVVAYLNDKNKSSHNIYKQGKHRLYKNFARKGN